MQTLIVHNREPLRTFRDLGPRGWLGLQVMMGAMILSALFHPIMVAALLAAILATIAPALANLALPLPAVPDWIGITALASLIIGYLAAIALNLTVAIRNGQTGLAAHALLTPVYWLFISFAAYQSFWQLLTSPHRWEKTRHRPRP